MKIKRRERKKEKGWEKIEEEDNKKEYKRRAEWCKDRGIGE